MGYSGHPQWNQTFLFCEARDRDTAFLSSSALLIEYYAFPSGSSALDEV